MVFGLTEGILINTDETVIYQASEKVNVGGMVACNQSIYTVLLNIHYIKNGSIVEKSNKTFCDIEIAPKESYIWAKDEQVMLDVGDKIVAIASVANEVSFVCSLMSMED